MEHTEAFECKGKKVLYDGEEYVLLQLSRKQNNLMPGVPNPFMHRAFDGLIYHEGRRAARMVPVEHLEKAPEQAFRMRLQFGEKPRGDAEELRIDA